MKSKFIFYLRFALILPACMLGIVIGQSIALISDYFRSLPYWFTPLFSSLLIGSLFFCSGFLTSPLRTKLIANIILTLYVLWSSATFALSIYENFEYNLWLLILNLLIGFVGAYYAYRKLTE